MDRADRISANSQRARAALAPAQRASTASVLADHRPAAAAQRAMIDAVRAAPAMVAQRRSLEAAFGSSAQFGVAQRAGPEDELQMKRAPGVAPLESAEEELQMKAAPGVAERAAEEDELQRKVAPAQLAAEEDELQMKRAGPPVQRREDAAAPTADGGLPPGLRTGVEALSGVSMEGVKVHYNSTAPAQLNALAYAQGSDIHLAAGQEQHLPHEAWHLVQQAEGRVQPTMQMKTGTPVNDDPGLEAEADAMGARAAALGAAAPVAEI
jgi:hypothetical protein